MFHPMHYKRLLEILLGANLKPSIDWDSDPSPNKLLLRHDVDFSVDYAYQMAGIEAELDVRSTYFFMLSSNMYNMMSLHNITLVKNIANLGHKVSIHFDPTAHDSLEGFLIEKKVFESSIDQLVEIVSIHRPGPFLDNNNISLDGIPQTYQDTFFRDMTYLSDSGGRDVFPLVKEYIRGNERMGLHLLIHPIWWVGRGEKPTEILNTWHSELIDFTKSEIRANCKTYLD